MKMKAILFAVLLFLTGCSSSSYNLYPSDEARPVPEHNTEPANTGDDGTILYSQSENTNYYTHLTENVTLGFYYRLTVDPESKKYKKGDSFDAKVTRERAFIYLQYTF